MTYSKILISFLAFISAATAECRNLCRTPRSYVPKISVCASDKNIHKEWLQHQSSEPLQKCYCLQNSLLRLKPIKYGFNQKFFEEHYIPQTSISYRTGQGIVSGEVLSELANELVKEIKSGKKKFTHFKVLKDSNFNHKIS